jgi:flavodoxin
MSNILVVTYSRTGNTARVGKELANHLDADFERIEELENRQGIAGFAIAALESLAKGLPSIRTTKDPSQYSLVVLGTPVWAGHMASPVRTYLTLQHAHLPRMAFFATMGGHGAEETIRELKFLTRSDVAPSCAFTQAEIERARYAQKLEGFAKSLAPLTRRESATLNSAADASTWISEPEPA